MDETFAFETTSSGGTELNAVRVTKTLRTFLAIAIAVLCHVRELLVGPDILPNRLGTRSLISTSPIGEGRRADVSSLCLASGVAPTTTNRYVDLLVDDELISKVGDADDGRRSFVNISGTLRGAIDEWLDQAEAGLTVAGWTGPSNTISDHDDDTERARSR